METEISKLQAQLDALERSQTAMVDSFYDNFKQNLEAAKKIQEMVSKKADPVYVKGAPMPNFLGLWWQNPALKQEPISSVF